MQRIKIIHPQLNYFLQKHYQGKDAGKLNVIKTYFIFAQNFVLPKLFKSHEFPCKN